MSPQGSHAQTKETKSDKHDKLLAAADRLSKKEAEERAKIQEEIRKRMSAESQHTSEEELKLHKLEAMQNAEQEAIE